MLLRKTKASQTHSKRRLTEPWHRDLTPAFGRFSRTRGTIFALGTRGRSAGGRWQAFKPTVASSRGKGWFRRHFETLTIFFRWRTITQIYSWIYTSEVVALARKMPPTGSIWDTFFLLNILSLETRRTIWSHPRACRPSPGDRNNIEGSPHAHVGEDKLPHLTSQRFWRCAYRHRN